MNLLLDTHIALWYASNDARLPPKARRLICEEADSVHYSIVSVWEVALKHSISKERMPVSDDEFLEYVEGLQFVFLPIEKQHVSALKTLCLAPGAKEHRDPFDRMLLCQAKTEGLVFLTHDALLQGYEEPCVLVV